MWHAVSWRTFLFAAAVLLAAAVGLLMGWPHSRAQTPPASKAPTPVWECLRLSGTPLFDPNAPVTLTTANFGADNVLVRYPRVYCESSNKYPITWTGSLVAPANGRGYECFGLQGGKNLGGKHYVLVTKNWGPTLVRVFNSELLCESATKRRDDRPGVVFGALDGEAWECFRIDASSAFSAKQFRLVSNNFGVRTMAFHTLYYLCESARKDHAGNVTGAADGRVLECRAGGPDAAPPNLDVTLTTANFGVDTNHIANGFLICERAIKIPLGPFPLPD